MAEGHQERVCMKGRGGGGGAINMSISTEGSGMPTYTANFIWGSDPMVHLDPLLKQVPICEPGTYQFIPTAPPRPVLNLVYGLLLFIKYLNF